MAIKYDRLLKLAEFLRQLSPYKFDINVIRVDNLPIVEVNTETGEKTCGTVACAMGWCPEVFPDLVKFDRDVYGESCFEIDGNTRLTWHDAAMDLFGISAHAATNLFHFWGYTVGPYDCNPSPQDVAAKIEAFVKQMQEALA